MERAGANAIAETSQDGANAETLRAIELRFQPVHAYRLKHSFAVRLLMACEQPRNRSEGARAHQWQDDEYLHNYGG